MKENMPLNLPTECLLLNLPEHYFCVLERREHFFLFPLISYSKLFDQNMTHFVGYI